METTLPAKIAIKFKGIKGLKSTYTGLDPVTGLAVECDVDNPASCLKEVSPEKARQLLVDFEDEWILVGNAADVKALTEAIMNLEPYKPKRPNAKASKLIQIVEPDGTVTDVPPGATVQIILAPDKKKAAAAEKKAAADKKAAEKTAAKKAAEKK